MRFLFDTNILIPLEDLNIPLLPCWQILYGRDKAQSREGYWAIPAAVAAEGCRYFLRRGIVFGRPVVIAEG